MIGTNNTLQLELKNRFTALEEHDEHYQYANELKLTNLRLFAISNNC